MKKIKEVLTVIGYAILIILAISIGFIINFYLMKFRLIVGIAILVIVVVITCIWILFDK